MVAYKRHLHATIKSALKGRCRQWATSKQHLRTAVKQSKCLGRGCCLCTKHAADFTYKAPQGIIQGASHKACRRKEARWKDAPCDKTMQHLCTAYNRGLKVCSRLNRGLTCNSRSRAPKRWRSSLTCFASALACLPAVFASFCPFMNSCRVRASYTKFSMKCEGISTVSMAPLVPEYDRQQELEVILCYKCNSGASCYSCLGVILTG